MTEDDDILGPAPRKRMGRPPGPAHERPIGPLSPRALMHSDLKASRDRLEKHLDQRKRERLDEHGEVSMHLQDVHAGVTVAWLSQVFGMDPTTVKKRLADCPPMHRRKAGFVYDLKQAAGYLVKPVFDVKKYLKEMRPSELPAQLQKEYWDAALKRQKWEENAGHLWRTEKIMEVFSDTFLTMKSTMQLWADDIEREVGITDAQRQTIVALVDALQNEIHRGLVELKSSRRTQSMKSEVEIDDPFLGNVTVEEDEDLIG